MFQRVPNSGPFNNDRLDELRSNALMSLIRDNVTLPEEVLIYFKTIERERLTVEAARKIKFLETSWDQFRGQP